MKLKKILSILIIASSISNVFSQVQRNDIIAAYIYNFAQLTTWPDENQIDKFKIALLIDNESLLKKFKKLSENQKIKDKEIEVTQLNNTVFSDTFQIIFIGLKKENLYSKTYDNIEHKPTLLVSENYNNKRIVMINLFDTKDNKIQFEVNKANILNQNLNIDEKILLLGGTEIDVAELYMQTKKSFRDLEKESEILKRDLAKLEKDFNEKNAKAKDQENVIETQSKILINQKKDLEKYIAQQNILSNKIKSLSEEISSQKKILEKEKKSIAYLADSLNKNEKSLKDLQYDIEQANTLLDYLKVESHYMLEEISEKDKILGEQVKTISRQEVLVYMFGGIIIFTLILLTILFLGLKYRKRKNTQLRLQKEEIESINEELSINSEVIITKNAELKKAITDLRIAQEQLVQSEKMASLGVLTAGIAHEINNPINFVFAGINSLQKDFNDIKIILHEYNKLDIKDKDLNKKLTNIKKLKKEYEFDLAYQAIHQTIIDIRFGADRTSDIVAGLKSFSRSDKDSIKHCNINEIIDSSLLMLRNKYKYRVDIEKNYEDELPDYLCSPVKLTQVFMNIIFNAIDSIRNEKGKIEITTKKENKKIKISVKDNGVGIDQEIIGKVFDPFFTTKDIGKGTGLGLSITYGIIQEYKGNIEVISEKGKGSEFIITLPIT